MAFPRAVVELASDGITGLLGQIVEAHSFGQILPDQAVGILIRAAFPGVMWGSKVEAHAADCLDFLSSSVKCTVSLKMSVLAPS